MSELTNAFVRSLVSRFPSLRSGLEEHIKDNHEILPHVFFGDLTRFTLSLLSKAIGGGGLPPRRALREILDYLEETYSKGDEELEELISVSFLENLPRLGEDGSQMRGMLGPNLRKQLQVIDEWVPASAEHKDGNRRTRASVFRFGEFTLESTPAVVANMPAAIGSKEALLDELGQRLRFPDYFGANWDALHECIRDLSWLPNGPIVVAHSDLPLAGDLANAKTYLSILADAVRKVPQSQNQTLVIVFPRETRDAIEWLLRLAASEELKR